jgi:hypothetical protein
MHLPKQSRPVIRGATQDPIKAEVKGAIWNYPACQACINRCESRYSGNETQINACIDWCPCGYGPL